MRWQAQCATCGSVVWLLSAALVWTMSPCLGGGQAFAAPPKSKKPRADTAKQPSEIEPLPVESAKVAPPLPVVAAAPSPPPAAPPTQRSHSVNLNPFGVAIGDYALNYQWRFAGSHAVLGELTAT
ncbi:MAG: hypothetical protein FJ100_10065 [Deltaproteobacteria bacterium]|nr:hypothetical protein [Deltaproteobacteria bacterium]